MNPTPRILPILCLAFSLLATSVLADPIDFSEVSLLVRARESKASIIEEVSHRKLLRALTPPQENTLKSQGASDSLIQALRQSNLALSAADALAVEARREQNRKARPVQVASNNAGGANDSQDGLHIFEVSVGHPVNLSQWGGPDYEFAFNPKCGLDEGRPDAFMSDNVRGYTHTATYLGAGRPDDSTTIFDQRNYVSVMNHQFGRGIRIDRRNPVWKKGVPYTLYPVYAAGGVALYYISASNDCVKLAVSTRTR